MGVKVTKHPIACKDNLIMMHNRETVLLGAEEVHVGITTGNEVIVTDPVTGFNQKVPEVVPQTIYSLKEQKHNAWFVLDLETGSRGWYPGKPTNESN